jgi:hypothetical protein
MPYRKPPDIEVQKERRKLASFSLLDNTIVFHYKYQNDMRRELTLLRDLLIQHPETAGADTYEGLSKMLDNPKLEMVNIAFTCSEEDFDRRAKDGKKIFIACKHCGDIHQQLDEEENPSHAD